MPQALACTAGIARESLPLVATTQGKLHNGRMTNLIFVDTETHDLPANWRAGWSEIYNWPRIVSVAWITARSETDRDPIQQRLIKPEGFAIATGASQVNGITTAHAMTHGVPLNGVLAELQAAFKTSDVVVAHNLNFDGPVIDCEFLRAGVNQQIRPRRTVCTMLQSTEYCAIPGNYDDFKWPKLDELHHRLFGVGVVDAHDAGADTEACFRCFWELVRRKVITFRRNEFRG